ncbi:hypothetical protein SMSP2_01652 [Limihaloglobus sulfuriphilus]|uniref:Uncharacterized protein n=1 Tax=Limihaloglobus sulfuriphilus TaxID=1851148 RepID=A0A1Q2MF02_9BACT|nr:hypothetical protein [Limihaloglobus sulfuriphilus]AQQ71281.1 hypothetical protein SMSP2_01652 [Limihaloglobus sulfuriphilus]
MNIRKISLAAILIVLISMLCAVVYTGMSGSQYNPKTMININKAIAAILAYIAIIVIGPVPGELTVETKLKLSALAVFSPVVFGILLWPAVSPESPYELVSLSSGSLGFAGFIIFTAAAFLCGGLTAIVPGEFGLHASRAAVPLGISIAAVRSGFVTDATARLSDVSQISQTYNIFAIESFLWAVIAAAGFAGSFAARKLTNQDTGINDLKPLVKGWKQSVMAVAAITAVSMIVISILGTSPGIRDRELSAIMLQPGNGQAAFAVLAAFTLCGWAAMRYFKINYIPACIAAVILPAAIRLFAFKQEDILNLTQRYPLSFLTNPSLALTPVMIISFGMIGAVCGYWLAVLQKRNAALAGEEAAVEMANLAARTAVGVADGKP